MKEKGFSEKGDSVNTEVQFSHWFQFQAPGRDALRPLLGFSLIEYFVDVYLEKNDKGKPDESLGRKTRGLRRQWGVMVAQLPYPCVRERKKNEKVCYSFRTGSIRSM